MPPQPPLRSRPVEVGLTLLKSGVAYAPPPPSHLLRPCPIWKVAQSKTKVWDVNIQEYEKSPGAYHNQTTSALD